MRYVLMRLPLPVHSQITVRSHSQITLSDLRSQIGNTGNTVTLRSHLEMEIGNTDSGQISDLRLVTHSQITHAYGAADAKLVHHGPDGCSLCRRRRPPVLGGSARSRVLVGLRELCVKGLSRQIFIHCQILIISGVGRGPASGGCRASEPCAARFTRDFALASRARSVWTTAFTSNGRT